jgi:hypothetical protein
MVIPSPSFDDPRVDHLVTPLIHFEFPSDGIMDFQEWFPCIDFESIPGYPNKYKDRWSENFPKFNGQVVSHVVKFLKYIRVWGRMKMYKYNGL